MQTRVLCLFLAVLLTASALISCRKAEEGVSSLTSEEESVDSAGEEFNGESSGEPGEVSEEPGAVGKNSDVNSGTAPGDPSAGGSSSAVTTSASQPATGNPVTLNVKDYGAVGDGATDDARAIFKAVNALRNSPPGSVLNFEAKTYYYKNNGTAVKALFYFTNDTDLTVKGNGCLIKLGGTDNYYGNITNCKNMVIEGVSFDYAEYKPAFAATVVSVDTAAGTAVVTADREVNMASGETYFSPLSSWFGVVASTTGRHHMYLTRYEMLDASARRLRVHFSKADSQTMSRLANGYVYQYGFVLPMPKTGHTIERGFTVSGNVNFTMRNVNVYSISRFAMLVSHNEGTVTFDGVNFVRAPYDQGLRFNSWRDVYHVKDNRAKVIWNNCKSEWNYDDVFNISAITMTVTKKTSSKDITLKGTDTSGEPDLRAGDIVSIVNTQTGKSVGRAKIKYIVKADGREIRVMLESELPGIAAGSHMLAWADEGTSPGSEMIGCDFDGTFRARAFLTLTNCKLYVRRFWIGLETIAAEGPVGSDVLFRNCQLTADNGGVVWEISAYNSVSDGYHVKNVVFSQCTGVDRAQMVIGANDEVPIR
jgi:hypothetical protein